VISFALTMFGKHLPGGGRADSDPVKAPRVQCGRRPFTQRAAQPAGDGHRKPALAPVYDRLRQVAQGIVFQKYLRVESPHPILDRKRFGEFHHRFVQKGCAQLQGGAMPVRSLFFSNVGHNVARSRSSGKAVWPALGEVPGKT